MNRDIIKTLNIDKSIKKESGVPSLARVATARRRVARITRADCRSSSALLRAVVFLLFSYYR